MSTLKQYTNVNVFDAAKSRIQYVFDHFKSIYVSFSGGKDSTVMLHMVMSEAIKRGQRVGILVIDLEAQYLITMEHVRSLLNMYSEYSDQYWICLPLLLRNAVSQYQPRWCCWDPTVQEAWVRPIPKHPSVVSSNTFFPFFEPQMEFEEFMELFGFWYGDGINTAAFVGIRCDESLNRFRTISSKQKITYQGRQYTTLINNNSGCECGSGTLYNVYPIYDWKTQDVWVYHAKTGKPWNKLYDLMYLAGLTIHQMRICQPYGDDQRRGLWLYHLIEPQNWFRVVARVNGANSGALYVQEMGNVMGYGKIARPPGHTWKSFCNLLLKSLPKYSRDHYISKFKSFIRGWEGRGYIDGIPDEAPRSLEVKHWAPSWRRLCKVLLRNDWWCKGIGLTQPKSKAYGRYLQIVKARKDKLK